MSFEDLGVGATDSRDDVVGEGAGARAESAAIGSAPQSAASPVSSSVPGHNPPRLRIELD